MLFRGQTLVATANYHPFDDRVDHVRPGGDPFRSWLNWHDLGATVWQWEPAAEFFARAYRRGEVPLWDPLIAGGVDAHVNVTQGQYFPPYVALLLAGNPPWLRDAYLLSMMALAGGCTFLLFHRHGMHPVACAAGAAFMLGGAMTLNANSIVGQAIAMLPVPVLAMDRFLAAPSPRRAAVAALAAAFAALSSFMPIVISGLLLIALQLAVHGLAGVRDPGLRRRHVAEAAAGAAATALGLALAGFLLLPVQLASRSDPAFNSWYGEAATAAYQLPSWPGLLSRVIPYSVTQGWSPYEPAIGQTNMFDLGVVPVLAALLASAGGRPAARRLLWFLAAAAVLFLGKLFGVPPAQWLARLPVFRNIHFVPYACAALGLAVMGLAALGVEGLVQDRPSRRRVAVLTAVFLALVAYAVFFAATHEMVPGQGLRRPGAEAARLAVAGAAVVGAAWLRRGGRIGGSAAGAAVLAALLLELVPLAWAPRYLRASPWTDLPRYVQFLKADEARFRIHSTYSLALTPNVSQGVGLANISSRHAFNSPRYNALVHRYFATDVTVYPLVTGLLPSQRVILDLLNVRYVVVHDPAEAELTALAGYRLDAALRDGRYVVLRNRSAWPRSYVASGVRVAAGVYEALDAVGTLSPREVVLEERPAAAAIGPETAGGDCQVREYQPERVRLEAVAPAPAVLVLLDNHMPGWTATVNGTPAPILYANVAFRAVEIPAGRSQIEFRYRTPGLRAGIALSCAAAAAVAVLLAWPALRRRPR